MNRTHFSLYYLVSYLTVAGLALFLVVFAIVVVGVIWTGTSYWMDLKAA